MQATAQAREIFDLLHDDLEAIEREFRQDSVSTVPAITDIGEYLRAGGGKRIRPALLLLGARLFDYSGQSAVRLGAVVEIIHTATLVHDDIIDEAEVRRGRPSANTQWGNSKCVLAGDWVLLESTVHDPVAQRVRTVNVFISAQETRLYPVELRYAWPSELDLMAWLAGLRLEHRWGGWRREEFTASSPRHISVYKPPSGPKP